VLLIKDAEALETLEKVDTLVVDKTGTLTEGSPRLVTVETLGDTDEETLLRAVASLERASEHPLAHAIVEGAANRGIEPVKSSDFQSWGSIRDKCDKNPKLTDKRGRR